MLRTQRHMRFHFLTLIAVLVVGLLAHLSWAEVVILLFTITLVLAAEMFNTAIEAVTDLVTQSYHPLAKFAKDIAAGAVLITTINALAVGFILFLRGEPDSEGRQVSRVAIFFKNIGFQEPDLMTVLVVTFVLLTTMIVMWKVAGGKGKLWKGGIISMHAAVGFFLATTILFTSGGKPAVGLMAFLLAFLVGQSRVEGGIHTLREVITGATIATVITTIAYLAVPKVF